MTSHCTMRPAQQRTTAVLPNILHSAHALYIHAQLHTNVHVHREIVQYIKYKNPKFYDVYYIIILK